MTTKIKEKQRPMNEQTVTQETRCSGCGGEMRFDPEKQSLICASCGAEPAPPAEAALECPNCGAELTAIQGTNQAKCGSCDSTFNMLNEGDDCGLTGAVPDDHRYITPFTVTMQSYQQGMINWLASENLTPTDIFDKMAIIRSEGCYIPYYFCTASYKVKWTASIGYDRTETFTELQQRRDSNGRMQSVPVTKTRVVTDWRPFTASAAGTVTNVCEASKFIKQAAEKVHAANTPEMQAGIKESYHGLVDPAINAAIDKKQPFDAKYAAGFLLVACDEPASKAYDKEKIDAGIRKNISASAPGDRIKDISFNGKIVPDYFLMYRPYWFSVYSYQSKAGGDYICHSTCDGTDASKHYGTRPIDKDRKLRIKKGFLAFKISLAVLIAAVLFWVLNTAVFEVDDLRIFFNILIMISAPATAVSGITGIIIRFAITHNGKKTLAKHAKPYLENPSAVFGRKSAKGDPTQ